MLQNLQRERVQDIPYINNKVKLQLYKRKTKRYFSWSCYISPQPKESTLPLPNQWYVDVAVLFFTLFDEICRCFCQQALRAIFADALQLTCWFRFSSDIYFPLQSILNCSPERGPIIPIHLRNAFLVLFFMILEMLNWF